MGKYLLDTDVIIEWLRRDEGVVAWLKAHDAAGEFLACTPVSLADIYAGLRAREEFISRSAAATSATTPCAT